MSATTTSYCCRTIPTQLVKCCKFGDKLPITNWMLVDNNISEFFDRVFPNDVYYLDEGSIRRELAEALSTTFCNGEFTKNALYMVTAMVIVTFYGTYDMKTTDVEQLINIVAETLITNATSTYY